MAKTNHKLEISKDGSQRVVCVANGKWRLQKATGEANTSTECNAWFNQGPPMDYLEAKLNASHELREHW